VVSATAAKRGGASPMLHSNPRVTMGAVAGRKYKRRAVLEEPVGENCALR
jgi:hypothetical protein